MNSNSILQWWVAAEFITVMSAASAEEHAHPLTMSSTEPPAILSVAQPLPEPLAHGAVVLPFSTEHLKIVPVYGAAATTVAPRIGHLHITVDDSQWHWVHSTNEPIVIQGLSHGTHKLTLELADPAHRKLDLKEITFAIP